MKITYHITGHPEEKNQTTGLGDVVHAVANPAAKIIDRIIKTDFSNCKSCEERRQKWNALMPDIKKILP